MRTNESKVAKRLIAYRNSFKLTQGEMGERLGVTQSHYSKLEAGSKIISFQSLRCFAKNEGDFSYIITGKEIQSGEMEIWMEKCQTKRGRCELYRLMVWIIRQGIFLCEASETEISDQTKKSLYLVEYAQRNTSIWKNIRDIENLSQAMMAAELDINIKRYRRIEKLEVEPDAELLETLYHKFSIPPDLFLNGFYFTELNEIWKNFTPEVKETLEVILSQIFELIASYEGKIIEKH